MERISHVRRAWIVCIGTAISMFTVTGMGINAFTAFQPQLILLRNFTNTQASLITTIRSVFCLLSLIAAGKFCKRIGEKNTMVLGILSFTLSCVIYGMTDSLLSNLFAAALCGLAYGFGGVVPVTLILTRWFREHKGLALGISASGSGVASIVAPPLFTWLIKAFGLRIAFLCEALTGLLAFGVVLLSVRNAPDHQLEANREDSTQNGDSPILKSAGFPIEILLAAFLIGAPAGPGYSHLSVLYCESGVTPMLASVLISVLGVILVTGKIVFGHLCDLFGSRRTSMLTFVSLILGMLFCYLVPADNLPLTALGIVLSGFGLPLANVGLSMFATEFSAQESFQHNLQTITVIYMLGQLAFGPFPGRIADCTGSYTGAYLVFAILSFLSMLLTFHAYHRHGKSKVSPHHEHKT